MFSTLTANYRRAFVAGRDSIIAPAVLMTEGVRQGSNGPLLYRTRDLAESASAWNGVPLTLGHPTDKHGRHVSGNSREAVRLGRVENVAMRHGALVGECWFDVNRVARVAPDLLRRLERGEKVELSTGLHLDHGGAGGVWNGKRYDAVALRHQPDHLAILVGQRGSCSLDDGCGVHVS